MSLNKRSSVRMQLHFDVDVYNSGYYLGRGMTRDIHSDGAFIRDYPGEVYQNDMLELRVILGEKEQRPVYLSGMVVRGTSEGVGVLFSYSELEFRRLLRVLCDNIAGSHSCEMVKSGSNRL